MRRYRVMIRGRTYDVGIEDIHVSPVRVTVDGAMYTVSIEEANMQLVTTGPKDVSLASMEALPERPAGRSERIVAAPMPGIILSVPVSAGDAVSRGQDLCVLEAMKMNNSIRSPREGVISAVHVRAGQTVAHGDLLFEFE